MKKNKPMRKKPYKEPLFLFTSGSLRQAAWAGWYSALGDKDNAEKFIHCAYTECTKEVAAGRKFDFYTSNQGGKPRKEEK